MPKEGEDMAVDPLKSTQNMSVNNSLNTRIGTSGNPNTNAIGKTQAQKPQSGKINQAPTTTESGTAVRVSISKQGQDLLGTKPPTNDAKVLKGITEDKKQNDMKLTDQYQQALVDSSFRKQQAINAYQNQVQFA